MALHNRNVKVYTKATWAGEWVQVYYLRPLSAVDCVAPEVPKAEFEYRYGKLKRHGATFFATFVPPEIVDQYVKIEVSGVTWWVGVIESYVDVPDGADVTAKAGRRIYTAYGLEHLLDRVSLYQGYCDSGVIKQVPTFNLRHSANGTVLGNRSAAEVAGHWAFSIDGAMWTVRTILDYCFDLFAPSGITWTVDGLVADLDNLEIVFDPTGMTLLEIVNALIDRRRGYAWRVVTTGAGDVSVTIFSAFPSDMGVGSMVVGTDGNDYFCREDHVSNLAGDKPITGAQWWEYWASNGTIGQGAAWADGKAYNVYWTFRGNDDPQTLSLDGDRTVREDSTQIGLTRSSMYDEVRVVGAQVKAVFSVSFLDGTLEAAWDAAQEAAYKAGVSAALAGYAALTPDEKAKANDRYRGDSRFDRVFQCFRIPLAWGWKAKNGIGTGPATIVNPLINVDGSVSTVQANWSELARGILRRLPLLDGINYSAGGWPSANDAAAQPQFKPILAFLQDADGKWADSSKPSPEEDLPALHVEPADREMGVLVKAKLPHQLARGVWDPTVDEWTAVSPIYDYRSLILTVAVECDEVLAVVVLSPSYPITESGRSLTIRVPDAELWYMAPGTVVGIDASGFLAHAADTPGVLRDDSERLRIIAALAMQWYGVERQTFQVGWKELKVSLAPGVMVTTLTVTAADVRTVNALLSRRAWNFVREETTLSAGWADIDWKRIAPVNVPGARTPKTLSKQLTQQAAARWGQANWEH